MTNTNSWRSLGAFMVVTIHVAVVASIFRTLVSPATLQGSLVWIPLTVSISFFLSWPVGKAVASAFEPGERGVLRSCPRCGLGDVRPVVQPGEGIFQPATGYRCASCRTIFPGIENPSLNQRASPRTSELGSEGIWFLPDLAEESIRFLDETSVVPQEP
jgi:hypothetical protein